MCEFVPVSACTRNLIVWCHRIHKGRTLEPACVQAFNAQKEKGLLGKLCQVMSPRLPVHFA